MAVIATIADVVELSKCLYKPLSLLILGLVLQTNIIPRWRFGYPLIFSIIYVSYPNMQPTHPYSTLPGYVLGFATVWIIMLSFAFLIPDQGRSYVNIQLSDTKGYSIYETRKYEATSLKTAFSQALRLLVNVRGIGWNHSARNIFRSADGKLNDPESLVTGKEAYTFRAMEMRFWLLRRCALMAVIDYLIVDIVLYLALRDDFLSGDVSRNPLWLSWSHGLLWFALLPYRVLVAGMGICSVLDLAWRILALISVGIFKDDYWNYPPLFGSLPSIWNRGLAGFWGDFWHQSFRYCFTSVALLIVPQRKSMDKGAASPKSSTGVRDFLRLVAVFAISGLMHAGGSYTLAASSPTPLLARSHPVLAFLSFVLQAPGIAIQTYLFPRYKPAFGNETLYKLKMLGFTMMWIIVTVSLLVADLGGGQFFKLPFMPWSVLDLALRGCRTLWSTKSFSSRVVLP